MRHLLVTFALAFSGATQALDLERVNFPLFYECRPVLAGGMWKDNRTGEFRAGELSVPREVFEVKIQRYKETKDPEDFGACELDKKNNPVGFGLADKEYCLTQKFNTLSVTSHCHLTASSRLKKTNHGLLCSRNFYLDTDRGYAISSLILAALYDDYPGGASYTKYDCRRLDR
jgi:hypothetical protein